MPLVLAGAVALVVGVIGIVVPGLPDNAIFTPRRASLCQKLGKAV